MDSTEKPPTHVNDAPRQWETPRGSAPMTDWNAYLFTTAIEEAAWAWVVANGSDLLDNYATSDNAFVVAAERAWSVAAARYRELHPPEAEHSEPAGPVVPITGCFLYRLWSDDGRLMYVGVSRCLRRRLAKHRRTWDETVWLTATWEEQPDVATMMAAELAAIRSEDPVLNSAGVE